MLTFNLISNSIQFKKDVLRVFMQAMHMYISKQWCTDAPIASAWARGGGVADVGRPREVFALEGQQFCKIRCTIFRLYFQKLLLPMNQNATSRQLFVAMRQNFDMATNITLLLQMSVTGYHL